MNYNKLLNFIPKEKDEHGKMIVPTGLIKYAAENLKDIRWFKTFAHNNPTHVDGTLFLALDNEDKMIMIINRLHPEDTNNAAQTVKYGLRKFAEGQYYTIDEKRTLLNEGQLDKLAGALIDSDHSGKDRLVSDFIGTVKSIYKNNPSPS